MTHAECQASFRGIHVREDGRTECVSCVSPATLYVTWGESKGETAGDVMCGKHRRTYANCGIGDPKPIAKQGGLCAAIVR